MARETPPDAAPEEETGDLDWLSLDDGEEILWSGKPHFYSIVPALVVGVPLSLVLVGIPIVAGAYLSRENTVYLLTTEGLYRKQGILSRDVQKIEFEKVQNISFSEGPLGKQFGYGNVDISTAGGSGVEMRFRAVEDPKSVQERINRQIRRSRTAARDEDETAARRTDDVLDDILAELRAIRAAVEDGSVDAARTPTENTTTEDDDEPALDQERRQGDQ
ncbi:PH domain-containing protein [Halobacteriaceae archaeon GCM10025711]